jgi:hypothetical protein
VIYRVESAERFQMLETQKEASLAAVRPLRAIIPNFIWRKPQENRNRGQACYFAILVLTRLLLTSENENRKIASLTPVPV